MGTMVMGKVHSGYIRKGQRFLLMPNKYKVLVDGIIKDDEEQSKCFAGDNVKLKLKNIDEKEISKGHVLCALRQPCSVSAVFDAQLVVLEWKSIITAGKCIHILLYSMCAFFNTYAHVTTVTRV